MLSDEMGRLETAEESFAAPLKKEREPSGDMVAAKKKNRKERRMRWLRAGNRE